MSIRRNSYFLASHVPEPSTQGNLGITWIFKLFRCPDKLQTFWHSQWRGTILNKSFWFLKNDQCWEPLPQQPKIGDLCEQEKLMTPCEGWPFKCCLYWGLHHSSSGRWNLSSVSSLCLFPNLSVHQNTRNTLNRQIQQTWDRIQELANSLKGPGSELTKPWESCHCFPWPWNTLHHSFFSFP